MPGALEGLRVVDLSPTRVGAQVSQLFADYGADVIMVEPPGGASMRSQPAFAFWARGKQSIELEYDTNDGWVFLAAPARYEWPRLAAALAGYADLDSDPRFGDPRSRALHEAALARGTRNGLRQTRQGRMGTRPTIRRHRLRRRHDDDDREGLLERRLRQAVRLRRRRRAPRLGRASAHGLPRMVLAFGHAGESGGTRRRAHKCGTR